MSTRLNQILTFTNVAPGGTVTLPHQINVAGVPFKPDIVFRDNSVFNIISCTETDLTVQNTDAGPQTLNAWLWHQHTFDREYGIESALDYERRHLIPQPFIPAANGGGMGPPGPPGPPGPVGPAGPRDRRDPRVTRATRVIPAIRVLRVLQVLRDPTGLPDLRVPQALRVTRLGRCSGATTKSAPTSSIGTSRRDMRMA